MLPLFRNAMLISFLTYIYINRETTTIKEVIAPFIGIASIYILSSIFNYIKDYIFLKEKSRSDELLPRDRHRNFAKFNILHQRAASRFIVILNILINSIISMIDLHFPLVSYCYMITCYALFNKVYNLKWLQFLFDILIMFYYLFIIFEVIKYEKSNLVFMIILIISVRFIKEELGFLKQLSLRLEKL